jgi:beta-glucosidase
VLYAIGVVRLEDADNKKDNVGIQTEILEKEALNLASHSDVVIFVGGISPNLEGEEMKVEVKGFSGGDRSSLDIPVNQTELLRKLKQTGKPVILVLTGGSALSFIWEKENLNAILDVWYPGEEGGDALADILFGDYNPAGRLPVTFYKSVNDLPAFDDYSMKGRTYRYFTGEPLYPFGYGLSYTTFSYSDPVLSESMALPIDTVMIKLKVKNTGRSDGEEVIQVYSKRPPNDNLQPVKSLVAFKRVAIKKSEEQMVTIPVVVKELRQWDYSREDYSVVPGLYDILIGSSSADIRLQTKLEIISR